MGLSDKVQQQVVSEEEIRKEVQQEVVKEQPKNLKTSVELSKDEITMILAKFAQLEFKGVGIRFPFSNRRCHFSNCNKIFIFIIYPNARNVYLSFKICGLSRVT